MVSLSNPYSIVVVSFDMLRMTVSKKQISLFINTVFYYRVPLWQILGAIMEEILKFLVENKAMIYMLVLSIFVGIEIISKVPAVLHTPLMSGANAIHGVVIVGAIIVMGEAKEDDTLSLILGFIAVILGTLNVVGGFVVTDRMLEMFKKKTPAKKD